MHVNCYCHIYKLFTNVTKVDVIFICIGLKKQSSKMLLKLIEINNNNNNY